jgi:hypothetical protein
MSADCPDRLWPRDRHDFLTGTGGPGLASDNPLGAGVISLSWQHPLLAQHAHLLAVAVTPTKGLRPLGIAFAVITALIWPAYYYVRSSVRSFQDGLAAQIPFKIGGVFLLAVALSASVHGATYSGTVNCPQYVQAEFKFFTIAVLGFIAIMVLLRSLRTEDGLARLIRRDRWPWPLRVIDGVAAVAVEIIAAPWVLEGFREVFQLPRSTLITWGLHSSNVIVSTTLGRVASVGLGSGNNFLDSGADQVNRTFTGHATNVMCGGGAYQGGWLLGVLLATALLPVAAAVSFEPLLYFRMPRDYAGAIGDCLSCEGEGIRWDNPLLLGALCPVCSGSGTLVRQAFENPLSVLWHALSAGLFLFGAWLAVDFLSFVIQIATGVTAFLCPGRAARA